MIESKAERAAKDAVRAYIENPNHDTHAAAWQAVYKAGRRGHWYDADRELIWQAIEMGDRPLVAVAPGFCATMEYVRWRSGFGPKPADAEASDAILGRMRAAETRVAYWQDVAGRIKARLDAVRRVMMELGGEVDAAADLADKG